MHEVPPLKKKNAVITAYLLVMYMKNLSKTILWDVETTWSYFHLGMIRL